MQTNSLSGSVNYIFILNICKLASGGSLIDRDAFNIELGLSWTLIISIIVLIFHLRPLLRGRLLLKPLLLELLSLSGCRSLALLEACHSHRLLILQQLVVLLEPALLALPLSFKTAPLLPAQLWHFEPRLLVELETRRVDLIAETERRRTIIIDIAQMSLALNI